MAGFRDEDDDLGDLLPPPTMTSSTYAFAADQDEEDLSASPWGDSTSSSTVYNPPSYAAYEQQRSPEPSTSSLPPTTPSYDVEPRHFTRESAPEPETPAYSRRASSTYNYDGGFVQDSSSPLAPTSPFQAPYSPPAITEQTPFGSPPISPTRGPYASHTRQASKPDLSALLGEEKPILPKFAPRRETPEGVAGPLGSKIAVLPVSSIGKKPVGGALATLLGLKVEEEEKEKVAAVKKGKEDVKTDGAATKAAPEATSAEAAASQPPAGKSSEAAPASAKPVSEDSTATSVPVASTSAEPPTAETPTASEPPSDTPASLPPPVLIALSTPLPPSPSVSPPPPSADSPSTLAPKRSSLSRTSSRAASTRTIDSSEGVNAYDSIVSPMEAEGAAEAWPGEEGKESIDGLEQKLEALKVDTTSKVADDEDSSMAASEPTPTESTGEQLPSEPALATPTPSTPPAVAATPLPAADEPDLFAQYTYASEAPSSAVSSARPSLFEAPISPTTNRGFRSHNGSTDEGVFGGADDAASLRGAYSRSVEVSETGEEARESMDVERAGVTSPPLPPLPTMGSPSIQQTSPRSTEMGGSLGPTTIISVGDPQTIGSSLNPAAQHTVYTVRTRVSSCSR